MQLPFSQDAFFDAFAAYNRTLWPAIVALWVGCAVTAAGLFWFRRASKRWISALLALLWAWALGYHVVFFAPINPAAWIFAALSLAQAALLVRTGVIRGRLSFDSQHTAWSALGYAFCVYALLYPALTAIEHGNLVRIPTFGVPCPTTIFTVGLLLQTSSRSWTLAIVPILWAFIGGSAAFALGVSADYALPIAGAALAAFELRHTSMTLWPRQPARR